ncbi:chemotaxis protein [Mycoplana rhizolycopersici]|uniref:Chemotaxis protein n=1 Tax=Mycoplana rhizolycopersici TaxID=2746702 RepID=A0ABX2QLZ9_9HYPH|nr:chemotaxis protein [Rhizobium rhizolycopersici]NVP58391.1 chemotaxis protein [Rhizobium rhizolycopersici]
MALALKTSSHAVSLSHSLDERLSVAHKRIETAFLEGGSTLVSVMEMVTGLIGTLNRFTQTLDADTADSTIAGLERTVSELALLPDLAAARHDSFDEIAQLCADAVRHVDDMRETFRYLKVFATTVKITGAGIAEFAEFADEIRDRIHSGAEEINHFAVELDKMQSELANARGLASGILGDFRKTIPEIVANLGENARRMRAQHEQMAKIAAEARSVAETVQRKIATALSALQIGDITRQRIEHVQQSFVMLDQYADTDDGRALSEAEGAGIKGAVFHLAYAQLDETLSEFREKCASIFTTISSFSSDASRILALREDLAGSRSVEGGCVLAMMNRDLGHACELVHDVEGRSAQSTALAGSVVGAVHSLIKSIETIRGIKTDISYMALNSNLRCSRLGDEGRSVNVVSGELRNFAAKLETPADEVVDRMHRVEGAAEALNSGSGSHLEDIGLPLAHARDAIAKVSDEMEQSLAALAEEGNAVFSRIASAVRSLDFEDSLGEVLDECVAIAGEMAMDAGTPAPPPSAADLSNRIYAIYTMIQERNIHAAIFPADGQETSDPSEARSAQSDEDFFDDALF